VNTKVKNGRGEIITIEHFISSITSRNHITSTEVANTYRLMTEAIDATFQLEGMKCARSLDDFTKTMILAMQGGWLTRHAYNWKCVDPTRSCDVPPKYGRIFKERILDHDTGLTRYMIRNETIASKTMYLLGLHALNTEHLLVAKAIDLTFRMGCTVHGCVVDGVMVKGSPEQLEELRTAALQNTRPDGTCYFRIKRTAAGRDIIHTAPKNPVEARIVDPVYLNPPTPSVHMSSKSQADVQGHSVWSLVDRATLPIPESLGEEDRRKGDWKL